MLERKPSDLQGLGRVELWRRHLKEMAPLPCYHTMVRELQLNVCLRDIRIGLNAQIHQRAHLRGRPTDARSIILYFLLSLTLATPLTRGCTCSHSIDLVL